MITESKPLSMDEVKALLKELKVDNKELEGFLKKFIKIKDSEKIKKEIADLGFMKIKPENIVKIVDTAPSEISELNKLFTETTLDENEATKVLEIVKKHK